MQDRVVIGYFLMTAAITASCGGAKFAGNSGKGAGSRSEQTTEQPTEASGGFGLTCMSNDNAADNLKVDFSCALVNDADQIFQEAPDRKLDVQVTSGEKSISVTHQGAGASSNFNFTLTTAEIAQIKMTVTIMNPEDQNKVLNAITTDLFNPITSHPKDAIAFNGAVSFAVLADTTQGNVSFVWQESPSNTQGSWITLQDSPEVISGSRTNQVTLGRLTSAKNNYYYRVKVFVNEKIKWRSDAAKLTVSDTTAPNITKVSISPASPSPNLEPEIKFDLDEDAFISLFEGSSCSTLLKKSPLRALGTNKTMRTGLLTPSRTYTIYLTAEDQAGNSSPCTLAGDYTTQLPAPTNLTVTSNTANALSLSWASVVGASSYLIYWQIDSPGVAVTTASLDVGGLTTYTHTNLTAGKQYFYKVAAQANNIGGALSDEKSAAVSSVLQGKCPINYVLVNANSELNTQEFCAAKYEMKNNGANNAVSQPDGIPWTLIRDTAEGAIAACQNIGLNYDLITNSQWQALARDIETAQDENGLYLNWSNNTTSGDNFISRGHSDALPNSGLAASTDNDPCYGTGNGGCADKSHADFTQKRTHTLKSGGVVWDVAGNVFEWVKDRPALYFPSFYVSTANSSDDVKKVYGPAGNYSGKYTGEYGGLGYWSNSGANGLIRGGDFGNNKQTGVFNAFTLDTSRAGIGFRCVFLLH